MRMKGVMKMMRSMRMTIIMKKMRMRMMLEL
jgi:hypothetical protein